MHAILNTFKSGVGDCVFMRLIKDDATFSIMIDCGKYTPEINLFIKEKLHKHIDLLIVTHIDDDHINGVCEMLIAMPEITIGKIFYNCYQLLSGEKIAALTKIVSSDIEILTQNLPKQRTDTNFCSCVNPFEKSTMEQCLGENILYREQFGAIPIGRWFGAVGFYFSNKF